MYQRIHVKLGREDLEVTYLSSEGAVDAASLGFLGLDKLILEGLTEHFAVIAVFY